ncbi:unnamed protein product [marine sediment metagenome]|uniref:Uncharacterized protein n=1 Tax=marine sediment metagenome TaxID=412755 RepID=X1EQZ9_9ZZZZ
MKLKRAVTTADSLDKATLIAALESQGNAVPPVVAAVLRIAAPILARLAIRYIARKSRKHFSDLAINNASAWLGKEVQGIIDRAKADSEKK